MTEKMKRRVREALTSASEGVFLFSSSQAVIQLVHERTRPGLLFTDDERQVLVEAAAILRRGVRRLDESQP